MCYCFKPIYTLCVCMVLVKLACHTLIYCAFSLACRHVYSLYDNCLSQQLCCNLPRIHNGKLLPQRKATRCLHKRLWKHQGRKLNSLWLTLQHHLRGQKKKYSSDTPCSACSYIPSIYFAFICIPTGEGFRLST